MRNPLDSLAQRLTGMIQRHPPGGVLAAFADNQLAPERLSGVRRHVASCPACAAEVERVQAALQGLMHAQCPQVPGGSPSLTAGRTRLEASIRRLAAESAAAPGAGSLTPAWRQSAEAELRIYLGRDAARLFLDAEFPGVSLGQCVAAIENRVTPLLGQAAAEAIGTKLLHIA